MNQTEKQFLNKTLTCDDVQTLGTEAKTRDNENRIKGIYMIHNTKTSRYYIGSSHNAMSRMKKHLSSLKSGKHPNKQMRKDYEEYDENNFIFEVVEVCAHSYLSRKEKQWLHQLYIEGKDLYNINELENWNSPISRMNRRELGR